MCIIPFPILRIFPQCFFSFVFLFLSAPLVRIRPNPHPSKPRDATQKRCCRLFFRVLVRPPISRRIGDGEKTQEETIVISPKKKQTKKELTQKKEEEGNEYFMVAEPNLFALFVRLFFSERNIRGQRSGVKNIYFLPLNYSRMAINTVQHYLARETVFRKQPSVV